MIALTVMMVAFAGAAGTQKVRLGLKVGADLTNFWDERVEYGMKPGYQVGALAKCHFNVLGCTYGLTDNAFVQARYMLGLSDVHDGSSSAKTATSSSHSGWKF